MWRLGKVEIGEYRDSGMWRLGNVEMRKVETGESGDEESGDWGMWR